MIQFLSILGDVMRVATFQWHDDRHHAKRREEPTGPGRWAPATGGERFAARAGDGGHAGVGIAFSLERAHLSRWDAIRRLWWTTRMGMPTPPGRKHAAATGRARGARHPVDWLAPRLCAFIS